jgi:ABC-type polysaccharide/polyol phosphate transport system ATPase subunit
MIVVTHNAAFVLDECTRAVWIHDKRIARDGDPASVVSAYRDFLQAVSEAHHAALG